MQLAAAQPNLLFVYVILGMISASNARECYECVSAGVEMNLHLFRSRGYLEKPEALRPNLCGLVEPGVTTTVDCGDSPCIEIFTQQAGNPGYFIRGCQNKITGVVTDDFCESGYSDRLGSWDQQRVCSHNLCNKGLGKVDACNEKSTDVTCVQCYSNTSQPCNGSSPGAKTCHGNFCFESTLTKTGNGGSGKSNFSTAKGCIGVNPFRSGKCQHSVWVDGPSLNETVYESNICYSDSNGAPALLKFVELWPPLTMGLLATITALLRT